MECNTHQNMENNLRQNREKNTEQKKELENRIKFTQNKNVIQRIKKKRECSRTQK